MAPLRPDFLKAPFLAPPAHSAPGRAATSNKLGIPGPYPGRVVEVHHPRSIVSGAYQATPITDMMRKGMMSLTGAPSWVDAWKVFVEPGDVVGIKVSPVGGKTLCSDALVLHQIVDGIKQAGVPARDIVVFNRYRQEFQDAGMGKWLPEGIRWTGASPAHSEFPLAMDGYDGDQ